MAKSFGHADALDGISKREQEIIIDLLRRPREQQRIAKAYERSGDCPKAAARERAPAPYIGHLLRLGERAFVRPSILQSLALGSLNDLGRTLRIVHAELHAV